MRGLVVAALVACVATAHADRRVVFVGSDAELEAALGDVLYADDTSVVAVGARDNPPLADLGTVSRELADTRSAVATVWLSPTASGATLVTYERSADRFVVREVPYPLPLNATQAAEAARMVRVMLRALRDADDEAAVTRPLRPLVITAPPASPHVAVTLGGGAWLASPETRANAMTALTVAWRPHGLGIAAAGLLAPATAVTRSSFRGDIRTSALSLVARYAIEVAPRIRVAPAAGLALHVVSLGGDLAAMERVDSRRFDPALQLGGSVAMAAPYRVELGLALAADVLLRRQAYETETEQILVVPRVQAMLTAFVGVRL